MTRISTRLASLPPSPWLPQRARHAFGARRRRPRQMHHKRRWQMRPRLAPPRPAPGGRHRASRRPVVCGDHPRRRCAEPAVPDPVIRGPHGTGSHRSDRHRPTRRWRSSSSGSSRSRWQLTHRSPLDSLRIRLPRWPRVALGRTLTRDASGRLPPPRSRRSRGFREPG